MAGRGRTPCCAFVALQRSRVTASHEGRRDCAYETLGAAAGYEPPFDHRKLHHLVASAPRMMPREVTAQSLASGQLSFMIFGLRFLLIRYERPFGHLTVMAVSTLLRAV